MHRLGIRLTARGWGLAGAAVAAVVVAYAAGWPAMLAVGAFLAGLVLTGVLIVAKAPFRVEAERRLMPPVVERGQPSTVHLVIGGEAATAGEWSDDVPRALDVEGAAAGSFGRLRGGAFETDYRVVPRVRGAQPVGPLRLERSDPFGVALAHRPSLPPTPLIVLPTIHAIRAPSALAHTDADPSASMVLGAPGDQRDIVARPYRSGDAMRQVDWRSTAHRGELMVRSEAAAESVGTAVVLDLRESSWRGADQFEWALEAGVSLLADAMRRRSAARLVTAAESATEEDDALVALATADTAHTGSALADLVRRARASSVVQVVHVLTGPGAAVEVSRLAPMPHGIAGIVTVVGGRESSAGPQRAWRVYAVDPGRSPAEAWDRG